MPFCKRALSALYALANSNRSTPPLVSRALKRTPSVFVFSDLYRITVPPLFSTLHTHSGPHRLWSGIPAHELLAKRTAVSESATMQLPVYRLRRILLLPRTWLNKAAASLTARRRRRGSQLGCPYTVRPDAARRDSVWDALQPHAPVALAVGLPVGVATDACKLCLAAR